MEGFATLDICGLTTVFLELVSYLQATCEGLEGGGGAEFSGFSGTNAVQKD